MSSIEMASNTTVLVSAVGVREQLGHASLTVQTRLRGRGPDVVLVLLGGTRLRSRFWFGASTRAFLTGICFGKLFDTSPRQSYSTGNFNERFFTRTEALCQTTIPNRVRQVPPDASSF